MRSSTRPGSIRRLLSTLVILGVCLVSRVDAATYKVGPSRAIRTMTGIPRLAAGDIVEIDAGTYREAFRFTVDGTATAPIVIRGVNGRPVFDGTGVNLSGMLPRPRALFQVEGDYYVIENVEFRNARNKSFNGAGIRVQGSRSVVVRDCRMTYNDMGMQADHYGDVRIESTEVAYNGIVAPKYVVAHNLYLGPGNNVTIRHSYVHHALSGQNVKLRAHYAEVLHNFIADSNEGELVIVDSQKTEPADSNALVLGNVIVSSKVRTGNQVKFVEFGRDRDTFRTGTMYLVNNTMVAGTKYIAFIRVTSGASRAEAYNNIFYGSNRIVQLAGAGVAGADNWMKANAVVPATFVGTIQGTTPEFVSPLGRDYRLSATSACRDAAVGGAPVARDGAGVPFAAAPLQEYVEHLSSTGRDSSDGVLDIGAYEHVPVP